MLAIIPAVLVIGIAGEQEVDQLLVLSQVILSLQLGFAVIPLIHFVSNKRTMGIFRINRTTRFFAWAIATLLVYLNLKLVIEEGTDFFSNPGNGIWKVVLSIVALGAVSLLLYVFLHPWTGKPPKTEIAMHGKSPAIVKLEIPKFKKIAVALDFSRHDEKLLAFAIGQGGSDS